VFTELITKAGVRGVQVEELWSLGDDDFRPLLPIYGLIFLFKWRAETDERPFDAAPPPGLFFARQVITNACATQALLAVLLNTESSAVDLGPALREFRGFAEALDAEMLGEAINGLDDLRAAHNSFSRPEPFISDEKRQAGKDDDVFHFIAYVPFAGAVFELDGLKRGPIRLCEHGEGDWLQAVRPHIEARIQRYSGEEIRFNLMAVIKDQREVLQAELDTRDARVAVLEAAGARDGAASAPAPVPLGDDAAFSALLEAGDEPRLAAQLAAEKAARRAADERLEQTKHKFAAWREENVRRKHNYVPMVVAMLRMLAEKGRLKPMIDAGTARHAERRATKQNKQ
jgi:ubiquitin carboxyl-terminal hydrolase L5